MCSTWEAVASSSVQQFAKMCVYQQHCNRLKALITSNVKVGISFHTDMHFS